MDYFLILQLQCAMVNKVIEETASSMKDQEMLYSIAFAVREKACEVRFFVPGNICMSV